jgi:arylsulfatase
MQTLKTPGTAYELYDLENDPAETNDLAESQSKMVQQLAKMCEIWKQGSGIVDYAEIVKVRPNDPF